MEVPQRINVERAIHYRYARAGTHSRGAKESECRPLKACAQPPYNRQRRMASTETNSLSTEVIFTRSGSVAATIEQLIRSTQVSLNAALYRFNSQRLARALDEAQKRGIRVRLIIDRNKYEESSATRQLLSNRELPFRAIYGRDGAGSKMHHKFAVVDDSVVLTGSYNWTFASEEENYENVLILREPRLVAIYRAEFEALWETAKGDS